MSLGTAVIERWNYSSQKVSGHLLGQDCTLLGQDCTLLGQDCTLHHCAALFLLMPMNTDELHK